MSEVRFNYTLQSFLNNPKESTIKTDTQRKSYLSDISDKFSVFVKNFIGNLISLPANVEYNKLDSKYKSLLTKEKIKRTIMRIKETNSVIMQIKLPSESVPGVSYDVCIEFQNANKDLHTSLIRVFSNAASFGFTYAYVFNKKGLIIPLLVSKLSKEMITQEPKIRNPEFLINYEKTIVYAMLYILQNKLLDYEVYSKEIVDIHPINFKARIRSFNQMNELYSNKKSILQKAKREEKDKAKLEKSKNVIIADNKTLNKVRHRKTHTRNKYAKK